MSAPTHLSLSSDPSLLERGAVAFRALRVLEKDPGDPVAGPLFNACLDGGAYQKLIRRLRQTTEGARMLDERPSLNGDEIDLDVLAALPDGTLGRAMAAYYRDHDIAPFHTTFAPQNDVEYISKRYRETHDLFHVITGYGTDVIGEMELQAFAMGHLGIKSPLMILSYSTVILARGTSHAADVDVRWGDYFSRLRRAVRRGKHAAPLLAFRYQEHWETPLGALRARLCPPLDGAARPQP